MRLVAFAVAAALVALSFASSLPTSAFTTASDCSMFPEQVVSSTTYIIPVGTVKYLSSNTNIVAPRVEVAGAILTAPGMGAGNDGVSICIQAEQVVVSDTGVICTGGGADGHPSTVNGIGSRLVKGQDGGEGGDLRLHFVDLPFNPGPPSLTVVSGGTLCTGDGGDGGDGKGVEPCKLAFVTCDPGMPGGCEETSSLLLQHVNQPTFLNACGVPICTPHIPTVGDEVLMEAQCDDTINPAPSESCDPGPSASTQSLLQVQGGAGGDAGSLIIDGGLSPTLSVAPQTIGFGTGGTGGAAVAVGDAWGNTHATGGTGGASIPFYNGDSPALNPGGQATLKFLSLGSGIETGQGGDGGDAISTSHNDCPGNECAPANGPNTLVAALTSTPSDDYGCRPDPCYDAPTLEGYVLCRIAHLAEAHAHDVCREAAERQGEDGTCVGMDGTDETHSGNTAPPGNPGGAGQGGASGSYGVGCHASFRDAGCDGQAGVACQTGSDPQGGNGHPAPQAAGGDADGGPGSFGLLQGGKGGEAYAEGMNAGRGGMGGRGADWTPCADDTPGSGGLGGAGGLGGDAEADGGKGGNSTVRGGMGGGASSRSGSGGLGGPGGDGGNGKPTMVASSGDPDVHEWTFGPGAPGGAGGFGNEPGTSDADPGQGGCVFNSGECVSSAIYGGDGVKGAEARGADYQLVQAPAGRHGES